MKTVRTKIEFMSALQKELEKRDISDINEILADFEQHFGDSAKIGYSEAEICEKLGVISEIAGQYAEEFTSDFTADFLQETTSLEAEASFATDDMSVGPLTLGEFGDMKEIDAIIKAAPIHPDAEQAAPPPEPSVKSEPNQNQYNRYNNSIAEGMKGIGDTCTEFVNNVTAAFSNSFGKTSTVNQNSHEKHNYQNNCQRNYHNGGIQVNIGGLIAALCVDIFVLSWAIPALFSVVIGLLSVPVALFGSGVAMITEGVLKSMNLSINSLFHSFNIGIMGTSFGSMGTILLGVILLCLCGLSVLIGIKLIKLCIKVVKGVINWHGKMIVGKPVFKKHEQTAF